MSEPTWDTVIVFALPGGERYRSPAMDAVMAAGFLEVLQADPPAWGQPLRTEPVGEGDATALDLDGRSVLAFDPNQPRDAKGRWGRGRGAPSKQEQEAASGQLAAPDAMSDFDQPAQDAILERAAWLNEATGGKFPKDVDAMADYLDTVYEKATPDQVAAGKVWYQEQHDELKGAIAGTKVDFDTAVAVTARFSPGRDWDYNLEIAKRTIRVHDDDAPFEVSQEKWDKLYPEKRAGMKGPGTYKPSDLTPDQLAFTHPDLSGKGTGGSRYETTGQVVDGIRMLRGDASPADVLVGTKVRNFNNNLRDPEDPYSVTVDIHQVHAMVPTGTPMPTSRKKGAKTIPSDDSDLELTYYTTNPTVKSSGLTDKTGMYPMFGSAIQKVAARRGMLPNQVQAITWLVQRSGGNK